MTKAPRYRIEFRNSVGVLDTIEDKSEPGCIRQIIEHLEDATWFFQAGDTLRFVDREEEAA